MKIEIIELKHKTFFDCLSGTFRSKFFKEILKLKILQDLLQHFKDYL